MTDFGLARYLDDEQGHTRPGDILGTPSYMAPEQAVGGNVGPACDVYALGAILYECLTGRPPFKGATALATLELVRYQEPVPPGQLQPGLPRDLQVITLKCLEKAPARRYPSADALADDLRRWLESRPISARPGGVGERVLKWARRRPTLAALIAVSVAALATLVGGGVAYERRLRQELGNTERALEQAQAEGERADDNSRKARDALRRMLFRTTQRGWNEVPRLKHLRHGLIEEALAFYEQMAKQDGDQLHVRRDVAWACLEAGQFQSRLGKADESRASTERAVQMAGALALEYPDDSRTRLVYANALAFLGAAHHQGARAIDLLEKAVAELKELRKADPVFPGVREQLAQTLGTLGATYHVSGRSQDALRCLEQSLELNQQLAAEHPNDPAHRDQLGRTRLNLAQACNRLNQQDRAARAEELAERDFEHVLAGDPLNAGTIEALAALRVNHSYRLQGAGQLDEAIKYVSLNLPMLERVLKLEPDDLVLRDRTFRTYGVKATFEEQLGRNADAAASWAKATEYGPEDQRTNNRLILVTMWNQAGDYRKAVEVADALRAEVARRPDGRQWGSLAAGYSAAANLAGKDTKLSPEERKKIQAHCHSEAQSANYKMLGAEFLKLFEKKPAGGAEKR